MAALSYDEALRRVLVHEGGYTNHPSDPGGPTNFGITIYDYRKYVKPGATAADVKAMKVEEAKAIYRAKYWGAMRCDDLSAGLDYAVFDYGVNSGNARAVKVLQRILALPDSGKMTDAVIAAVKRSDARKLAVALCDEWLRFLQSLRTWPVFGAGWGRRVAEVKAAALGMADASAAMPQSAAKGAGKGVLPTASGAQKSTAGVIAAAGATAAQQAHESGAGIGMVVAIAAIGAGLAFASWFAWHWWQKRRQEVPALPKEKVHGLE